MQVVPVFPSGFVCFLLFFFFQAEDGIRDATVTGVQTCALPICNRGVCGARAPFCATCWAITRLAESFPQRAAVRSPCFKERSSPARESDRIAARRSEERRVGKECRTRGGREQGKNRGTSTGGEE